MTAVLIVLGVIALAAMGYCVVKAIQETNRKVDRILAEEREHTEQGDQ